MTKLLQKIGITALLVVAVSSPVQAYLGPGGVISGLGSFLALLAAVAVAIVGFLWFPIKRLIKRNRAGQGTAADTQKTGSTGQDS